MLETCEHCGLPTSETTSIWHLLEELEWKGYDVTEVRKKYTPKRTISKNKLERWWFIDVKKKSPAWDWINMQKHNES